MVMTHPVKLGLRTRQSFSKIKEVLEMPNLLEVQLDSYKWFIEKGLQEVFDDIHEISDGCRHRHRKGLPGRRQAS